MIKKTQTPARQAGNGQGIDLGHAARATAGVLSGVALAFVAGPVVAQDAAEATTIEEVVVTAARREQSFSDVPIAVSALSADRLADAGINEFEDLAAQVPSLEVETNTNPFVTSLRVRGMGNLANIPNFEPAVGLFIDGAYRSRSGVAMGDLLDVARIEILRGPQSVLYPKNVTAGVVSVITQRPTDEFSAWGGATAGNLNYWQLQGGVNGALSDSARARLAVVASDRDGAFKDIVNGTRSGGFSRQSVRGQIEFDLGERGGLRLVGGYSDKEGDCCSPDVLLGNTSRAFMAALGRPSDTDPLNRRTAYSDPYRFTGTQYDLLAEFDYDLGWAALTATSSFDRFDLKAQIDSEQSALTAVVFVDRQDSKSFGQEIRLTSQGEGPISWMTGGYFFKNDFVRGSLSPDEPIAILGPDVIPLPLPGTTNDQSSFRSDNETRHWSLFGQADWQVTPRTRLSAGVRYIDESKSLDARSTQRVAALPSFATTTTVPVPVVGDRDTDGLTWNVSALFDVAEDTTAYATVAQGFKAGGYNGDWDAGGTLTAALREFADEEVLNIEAGLKSRFWGDRATLNLSAFRSEFDQFQNASFLGTNFLIRNAETVRTQGIELDGRVRPATGLSIDYAVTYLDAEYEKFTQGACYFGRTPTNAVARTCDLSGQTLPNAPQWRTNLGVQYERALLSGTGFLRADWAYSAEQNVDTALDPRAVQEAVSLLSARLGWRNDRFSVTLWGENLTDETVKTTAGPQTIFGGIDGGLQIWLNDPRTYGVSVDMRF
jgi:outer membrane receptor protein involved in Fe transport